MWLREIKEFTYGDTAYERLRNKPRSVPANTHFFNISLTLRCGTSPACSSLFIVSAQTTLVNLLYQQGRSSHRDIKQTRTISSACCFKAETPMNSPERAVKDVSTAWASCSQMRTLQAHLAALASTSLSPAAKSASSS